MLRPAEDQALGVQRRLGTLERVRCQPGVAVRRVTGHPAEPGGAVDRLGFRKRAAGVRGKAEPGDLVPAEPVGFDRTVDHEADGPEGQAAEPLGIGRRPTAQREALDRRLHHRVVSDGRGDRVMRSSPCWPTATATKRRRSWLDLMTGWSLATAPRWPSRLPGPRRFPRGPPRRAQSVRTASSMMPTTIGHRFRSRRCARIGCCGRSGGYGASFTFPPSGGSPPGTEVSRRNHETL